MTSHRVAAIDCGTNSLRLLVADVDPDAGTLTDLDRRMEIVRLGQGVDRTGRIAPEALERTLAACRRYAVVIADLGATRIRMIATSASRDAENADEFVRGVHRTLGLEPEVVTGDEEAALSYAGATRELASRRDVAEPYLVADIGGGSTELVRAAGTGVLARSVDIGSVRLTERHFADDPPTEAQIGAATRDVDAALFLAAQVVPLDGVGTLVGVAGSVTTIGGIALELPAYDRERVHHSRMTADRVHEITENLLRMPRPDRAAMTVIHPGRVDVIAAGALILDRIVRYTAVTDVLVSEHDNLDGVAWSLVE
ncbi:MAG: Ppx/GppA family phosphatase [Streptosporangiales bacterium]|nr:Ppx/GppA family phosphatase [Streptosporangiales bacterium]MBO0890432.1 Ppx/GppA family phosphatase [Acidothermales bacterium]